MTIGAWRETNVTEKKVSYPVRRRKRGRNAKSTVFGGAYISFFVFIIFTFRGNQPTSNAEFRKKKPQRVLDAISW